MLEGDAKDSLVENDIKEEIKKSPNKTRIILFVTIGAVVSGIIVVLVIYFIRNQVIMR